jgi:hypothetical protein
MAKTNQLARTSGRRAIRSPATANQALKRRGLGTRMFPIGQAG